VVYLIVVLTLFLASWLHPVTEFSAGESSASFPALPVITLIFAVTGWMGLRKSVHFLIISVLLLTVLILITGVMGYGWYIMEIATLFFVMGLIRGRHGISPEPHNKALPRSCQRYPVGRPYCWFAAGIIIILDRGI
jgi:hypothetical protein